MPRKKQPPRLLLRHRDGREPWWIIKDGTTERSTGCCESDLAAAEEELAAYIVEKYRPEFGDGSRHQVPVAAVLDLYMREKGGVVAAPETMAFNAARLLEFWGDKNAAEINGTSCREYVEFRANGGSGRKVKPATARRELDTLQAALNYAHKEGRLKALIPVTKPPAAAPRDRWLTRTEVAELLLGALGFVKDEDGRFRRKTQPQYHVARFILVAVYTGTRHHAALTLRWGVNSEGGWVDLPNRKIYRLPQGQLQTNKRRPPAPIPPRLLPHLKRWRRLTINGPCEYFGKILPKQRRGFNNAADRAGLGEITPHVFKHTAITWMMQNGVDPWDVSGFTGTSLNTIIRVYGHHSPDYLNSAADGISWAKRGQLSKEGVRNVS